MDDETFCPHFHRAVELVGKRWTGVVLRELLRGTTRFSDLRAAVPGLSDRMLAERLRELQAEGIIDRDVHDETPVRIEYGLTAKGQQLQASIEALSEWAEKWMTR